MNDKLIVNFATNRWDQLKGSSPAVAQRLANYYKAPQNAMLDIARTDTPQLVRLKASGFRVVQYTGVPLEDLA